MFLHSFTLCAPYQSAASTILHKLPNFEDVFLHPVLLVSNWPWKDAAKSLEFEANRDAETPFAAREEAEGVPPRRVLSQRKSLQKHAPRKL